MKQITQAYLIGIKEGRQLNNLQGPFDKSEIQGMITNLQRLVREYSGSMKGTFKGELDFWTNQLKKG